MRNRTSKSWTLLTSMLAVLVLGLSSAALALAEPDAPANIVASTPLPSDPLNGHTNTSPLDPDPIGPALPDPKPDPEPNPQPNPQPKPEPKPVDPQTVVVLKPGQTGAEIDAQGRFTGSAEFKSWADGQTKYTLIVSGRTLDQDGRPVPGATIEMVVDSEGYLRRMKEYQEEETEPGARTAQVKIAEPNRNAFPEVHGFSDKNGNYRLRVTYHASSAGHSVWIRALHDGYSPGVQQNLDVSNGERAGVDLRLAETGSVSGRCVDENGLPVADVQVYASGEASSASAVTDKNGRFTLTGLSGEKIEISCWSEIYTCKADGSASIEVNPGRDTLLPRDLRLHTQTAAEFDLNLAGADDAAYLSGDFLCYDNEGKLVRDCEFDCARANGGYHVRALLEGLPAGSYRVVVHVSGRRYWKGELWVTIDVHSINRLGSIYLSETKDAPPSHDRPRIKCLD